MSEPEQHLARTLAETAQPPDEQFIGSVMRRIAAAERRRALVLGCLTLVAMALAGSFTYGLISSAALWASLVAGLPENFRFAVQLPALAGFGLAGMLLPPLLARAIEDGL